MEPGSTTKAPPWSLIQTCLHELGRCARVTPRLLATGSARLLVLSGCVAGFADTASHTNAASPIVWVASDGAVDLLATSGTAVGREQPGVPRRFVFGLPDTSPTKRELEDRKWPVARTQWERKGVRYTQLVLLTRLSPGQLFPDGRAPDDAVLLVQIIGENTASEYIEATAEFAVATEGRRLEIELRDGRVWGTGDGKTNLLAVIDVAATGIAGTNGSALRFRGSMPPGTSGAMTIKIPLVPPTDEAAARGLAELEFDDEFRRVKRYWAHRVQDGCPLPLALTESRPAPTSFRDAERK
jgi:hypothetical protein